MAEPATFYLEIITPERQFYIGQAEALIIPIVDGEMDQYPEAAFFNVGTISDVEEKAKALEKEGI